MGRLDATYKCRLCGKEYVKCSTGTDRSSLQLAVDIVYRATAIKEPKDGMEPALWELHWCEDGSLGVADFLGFKMNKDGKNG